MPYKSTDPVTYDLDLIHARRVAEAMAQQSNTTVFILADTLDTANGPAAYTLCVGDFPAGALVHSLYTPLGTVGDVTNPLPLAVALDYAEKPKSGRILFGWRNEPGIYRVGVGSPGVLRSMRPAGFTAYYPPAVR